MVLYSFYNDSSRHHSIMVSTVKQIASTTLISFLVATCELFPIPRLWSSVKAAGGNFPTVCFIFPLFRDRAHFKLHKTHSGCLLFLFLSLWCGSLLHCGGDATSGTDSHQERFRRRVCGASLSSDDGICSANICSAQTFPWSQPMSDYGALSVFPEALKMLGVSGAHSVKDDEA